MKQTRKRASLLSAGQAQPTQGAPDKNRVRGRSALVTRKEHRAYLGVITADTLLPVTNALLSCFNERGFSARLLPGSPRVLRITSRCKRTLKRVERAVLDAAATALLLFMLPLMGAAGEIGFWLVVKLYAIVLAVVVVYFFIRAYLRDRATQKRNQKYYQ